MEGLNTSVSAFEAKTGCLPGDQASCFVASGFKSLTTGIGFPAFFGKVPFTCSHSESCQLPESGLRCR